jgi:hypothetical protein
LSLSKVAAFCVFGAFISFDMGLSTFTSSFTFFSSIFIDPLPKIFVQLEVIHHVDETIQDEICVPVCVLMIVGCSITDC